MAARAWCHRIPLSALGVDARESPEQGGLGAELIKGVLVILLLQLEGQTKIAPWQQQAPGSPGHALSLPSHWGHAEIWSPVMQSSNNAPVVLRHPHE